MHPQREAPVVWAGDPDWRTVTTGMSADLFDWLQLEARRHGLTRSEMVRHILISAYTKK